MKIDRINAADDVRREAAVPQAEATTPRRLRPEDLRYRRSLQFLLGIITAIALLFVVWAAQAVLIPIVAAIFIAILLNPPVDWLNRVYVPRLLGAALVLVSFLALVGVGVANLSTAARGWVDRWPTIAAQIDDKLSGLRRSLREASEAERALSQLTDLSSGPRRQVVIVESPSLLSWAFASSTKFLAGAGACLFLTLFLLAAGPNTFKAFITGLPRRAHRIWTRHYAASTQKAVAQYIRTLALVNLGVGLLVGSVLYALDFPSPVLFGSIVAGLNAVPYVGPALIAAMLGGVGLVTYDAPMQWLLPLGIFWLVHVLESNLVTPLLLGRRLALNPIAVITMLLIWGWLWGIAGLILAVPLLIAAKVVVDSTAAFAVLRPLLGSERERRLP
jgi:predicted PurR-regulated permease PerM